MLKWSQTELHIHTSQLRSILLPKLRGRGTNLTITLDIETNYDGIAKKTSAEGCTHHHCDISLAISAAQVGEGFRNVIRVMRVRV